MKHQIFLIVSVGLFLQVFAAKSKYNEDGEDNPYEFGFTIDGQQHRHEKKDANGIIQGEFGFITADGIYHVTVYATDENGNFRILSMKNVRVSGPLDEPNAKLPDTSQFGKGNPKPAAPAPAPNPLAIKPNPPPVQSVTQRPGFTTQATIKPACAGCGYVTQKAPSLGGNNNNNVPKLPFQTPAGTGNKVEAPFVSPPIQSVGFPAKQPSNNGFSGNQQNRPGNQPLVSGNQQGQNGNQPGFPGNQLSNSGNQPGFPGNNQPSVSGNQPGFPGNQPNNPGNQPGFPGNNQPSVSGNQPGFPIQNDPLPNPLSNPSGITVDNGMINIPNNPSIPIKDKFPNMVDGLPAGINTGDITDLLYKFNYTVGFHGHYEKGYKNGAKVGGYFVNDRDGVSRIVTYVADENGYRPKVKFIRLDLNSDLVPKEGTEKTFGLKNFEFIWYPIN